MYSQQPQSQSVTEVDELEKWRRDLDERQKEIERKELYLKRAPIEIKVLRSTKAKRELELSQVEEATKLSRKNLKVIRQEIQEEQARFESQLKNQEPLITRLNNETTKIRQEKSLVSNQLRDLKLEVKDARNHLKEIQAQIERATEDGNLELKSIHYAVEEGDSQKKQINRELYELNLHLSSLEDSVKQREQDHSKRLEAMEVEIQSVSRAITTVIHQKEIADVKLQAVNEGVDKKLRILTEKEEGIMAKRSALIKEMQEIRTARRRWESSKSLYDDIE